MKTTFTTLLVGKKGRISGHTSVSTVSDIQKCLPNFSPENKGKAELIQAALLSGKKTPKWTSLFFFPSGAPIATPFPTEHNKVRDKINHTSNCCNDN
jgi:hypothetical protein